MNKKGQTNVKVIMTIAGFFLIVFGIQYAQETLTKLLSLIIGGFLVWKSIK